MLEYCGWIKESFRMEKFFDYIKKHADLFTFLGLLILCYFIFFFNIGNYPLMDVDETRYVSMSRDMFHFKDFSLKNRLFIFGVNVFLLQFLEKLPNLRQDFRLHCTEHFQHYCYILPVKKLFLVVMDLFQH